MSKTQYYVEERGTLDEIIRLLEDNELTNNKSYAKFKETQSKLVAMKINTLINVTTDNALIIYTLVQEIMEDGKFTFGDSYDAYKLFKEFSSIYSKFPTLGKEIKNITPDECLIWFVNLYKIATEILNSNKK